MISPKPLDPIQPNLLRHAYTSGICNNTFSSGSTSPPGPEERSKYIESKGIFDGLLESIFNIMNMSRCDSGS